MRLVLRFLFFINIRYLFYLKNHIPYYLRTPHFFFRSGKIIKNLSCFFYLLLLFFCSKSLAIDPDLFFEALKKGHKADIEQLIQEDENFDVEVKLYSGPCRSNTSDTPLMVAAEYGHIDIVEDLITRGADIDAKNNHGYTALMYAAKQGHMQTVAFLINHKADLNLCDYVGDTALIHAVLNGKTEVVKYFLDRGSDINIQNCLGCTPLMEAILCGHSETAILLINSGADLNLRDYTGNTPLTDAASYGCTEVVKHLLKNRVNINIRSPHAGSPLMRAILCGHSETAIFLINSGADLNFRDFMADTPLINAAWRGQTTVVKHLAERGVDVNAQNKNGNTSLMQAAMKDHSETIIYLIEKKADVNIKSSFDLTPLLQYMINGKKDFIYILALLIAKGANFDIKNPLHACRLQSAFERFNKKPQKPNGIFNSCAYRWNAMMTLLQLFKSDDLNNCRIEKGDPGEMNLIFEQTQKNQTDKHILIKNLPAPETLISDHPLQDAAEYVILKTHRFDEIDGLPLPAKLINNIKNKRYLPLKFYSLFEPYLKVNPLNCTQQKIESSVESDNISEVPVQ